MYPRPPSLRVIERVRLSLDWVRASTLMLLTLSKLYSRSRMFPSLPKRLTSRRGWALVGKRAVSSTPLSPPTRSLDWPLSSQSQGPHFCLSPQGSAPCSLGRHQTVQGLHSILPQPGPRDPSRRKPSTALASLGGWPWPKQPRQELPKRPSQFWESSWIARRS